MTLPQSFTTVTPLSKTLALLLFITLPIIAFVLGMNYQRSIYSQLSTFPNPTIVYESPPPYVPTATLKSINSEDFYYSLPLQKTACIPGPAGGTVLATLNDGSQIFKLGNRYIRTMGNICE